MERTFGIQKKEALCFYAALAVMLAVGSFADYPLSCILYDPNNLFGKLFAAYGEYPASLGLTAAGTLLVVGRSRENRLTGVLQIAGGILLAAMGVLMACVSPMLYLDWPRLLLAGIGLACSAAAVLALRRLCADTPRAVLVQAAAVLALAIIGELLLINLIKIPWGRPRMRLLAQDARAVFAPWWQPGTTLRDALVAAGVNGEEFKSFPSGHSGNAITLVLLTVLPLLNARLAPKRRLLLFSGCGWGCAVAFSRRLLGAHCLSDTAVGMACGFTCGLLALRLAQRARSKTR